MSSNGNSLDEGIGSVKFESLGPVFFRPFERCEMSGELKSDEVDDTPEYPLPSPTDPLGRDDLPLEDEEGDELSDDRTKDD
ncbi:hypothetical protein PS732_02587 [Pseudomonas fluorescens]|uniref:Uncharacterized protein n=1 Tax=Pseudomonas fluorescens TaxID=294 RepID=A0ABD7VG49_PSEFL|nr:hypothetical protein [Pseudomonas fluorescens]VVO95627.1 hypothetical protein PS732_02587 [Pseudomonas fluorescens]